MGYVCRAWGQLIVNIESHGKAREALGNSFGAKPESTGKAWNAREAKSSHFP